LSSATDTVRFEARPVAICSRKKISKNTMKML